MVIKEYRCAAHGYFESGEASPSCPKGGCTTVQQVFLTAPAFRSDKTKRSDANLRQIASDFGLTDMRSAREGEPARIKTKQQKDAEALQEKFRHRFAPLGKNPLDAIKALGAQPTDVMAQAKENFIKPVHDVSQYQHPVIVRRDPDRDSVAKAKAA